MQVKPISYHFDRSKVKGNDALYLQTCAWIYPREAALVSQETLIGAEGHEVQAEKGNS